jgi:hypothetical protein
VIVENQYRAPKDFTFSVKGQLVQSMGLGAWQVNVDGAQMIHANQYGVGIGSVAPSNTDDFVHIERNVDTSTGILIYNKNETANADAFIHVWGGEVDGAGSDYSIRAQSGALGGNVNFVAKHGTSNGTFNLIEVDNKTLNFYTYNKKQVEISPAQNAVNYLKLKGGATNSAVNIAADGTDTHINITYDSKGSNGHFFRTNAGAQSQVFISHTASANRYLTLTGSNGANPTIGASAGDVGFSTNVNLASAVLKVSGTQVVGAQGAAVADATDNASAITQLNALLARLRTHGLIAT